MISMQDVPICRKCQEIFHLLEIIKRYQCDRVSSCDVLRLGVSSESHVKFGFPNRSVHETEHSQETGKASSFIKILRFKVCLDKLFGFQARFIICAVLIMNEIVGDSIA